MLREIKYKDESNNIHIIMAKGGFTGYKDKNGKEIYESDNILIKIHDWQQGRKDNVICSATETVIFQNGKYGIIWGWHRDFTGLDSFHNTTFEIVEG